MSVPSKRTLVITGPTASVAAVGETSVATTLPTASVRVVFWSCMSGVIEVSALTHSVSVAVSPVPLTLYPVTTYPATETVVPSTVPASASENPIRMPSI